MGVSDRSETSETARGATASATASSTASASGRDHGAATGVMGQQEAWLPLIVTAVLILVVMAYHLGLTSVGDISHYDEFYTLDRTTSFARHGDWFHVYSENKVTFRKPPLQYWIGAGLLESGVDLKIALRLPSMMFAFGTLVATAFLAATLLPGKPWVMPLSVILLASSGQFWALGLSAMLDMGATFFALVAVTATIIALKDTRWWYVVAVAIGLGALQKAPIGLLLVALYLLFLGLTTRWHPYRWRTIRADPRFRKAVKLALLLTFSWHILQLLQHGAPALSDSFGNQMFKRFAPSADEGVTRSFGDLAKILLEDEYVLRGLGCLALVLLPWRLRRFDLLPLPLILLTYVLAISFATGNIYSRYSLIFIPYLCAALAALSASFGRRAWIGGLIVIPISLLSDGPLKAPGSLRLANGSKLPRQIEALKAFSPSIGQEDLLTFCSWNRKTRFAPGMLSYYGSANLPFHRMRGAETDKLPNDPVKPGGVVRGVCTLKELVELSPFFEGVEVYGNSGDYMFWTAQGVVPN